MVELRFDDPRDHIAFRVVRSNTRQPLDRGVCLESLLIDGLAREPLDRGVCLESLLSIALHHEPLDPRERLASWVS